MRPIYKLLLITLFLGGTVGAIFSFGNQVQLIYTCSLIATLVAAKDTSIKAIIYILLAFSILEFGFFASLKGSLPSELPNAYINLILMSFYLICDWLTYYIIKSRAVILLKLSKFSHRKAAENLVLSPIDAPLIGIFFLFCLIDGAVITENIIRNLEHFGMSESFAQQFWHWDWFYYASQPIKLGLQALTIMVLFAGIYITRSRAARGEKPLSYEDCSTSNQ